MCVYTCTYTHVFTYIYIYIYVHIHMYLYKLLSPPTKFSGASKGMLLETYRRQTYTHTQAHDLRTTLRRDLTDR